MTVSPNIIPLMIAAGISAEVHYDDDDLHHSQQDQLMWRMDDYSAMVDDLTHRQASDLLPHVLDLVRTLAAELHRVQRQAANFDDLFTDWFGRLEGRPEFARPTPQDPYVDIPLSDEGEQDLLPVDHGDAAA